MLNPSFICSNFRVNFLKAKRGGVNAVRALLDIVSEFQPRKINLRLQFFEFKK